MNTLKTLSLLAIIISMDVTLCAVAFPAHAADASPRMEINAAGVDISSIDGVNRLKAQVRSAARAVCSDDDSKSDLGSRRVINECYKAAVSEGYSQIEQIQRHAPISGSASLAH